MRVLLMREGSRSSGAFLNFSAALFLSVLAASGCAEQHAGDTPGPQLENTFESPEAVSQAVLTALEAGDYPTLRSYALSEEEFRDIVWPELPSSRPGRNVPLSYAWGDLNQKATSCLKSLVAERGGRHYELVRVEFEGSTTPYESFLVHRDARLVVRDDEGIERRVDFFGSIIENRGRYKLFSYNVD